jgi:hypothetical protein
MLPLWSLSDTNRQENQLLIEALMRFQFNQVGGGTKTRRPGTAHALSPYCRPRWFLLGEDEGSDAMTLTEIQDYIDKENRRWRGSGSFL